MGCAMTFVPTCSNSLARQMGPVPSRFSTRVASGARGTKSAGVNQQQCGATGRVEHCQVGVLSRLCHPKRARASLIVTWICQKTGSLIESGAARSARLPACNFIPNGNWRGPCLSEQDEAGLPFDWVVADSVYGRAVDLRAWRQMPGYAYAPSSRLHRCGLRADI
jgi:hypothetical protein